MHVGRKEIVYRKSNTKGLSIPNDTKATSRCSTINEGYKENYKNGDTQLQTRRLYILNQIAR